MEHRAEFMRNIAANIVSNIIVWIVCLVGAGMMALLVIVSRGLLWWQAAIVIFLFAVVLMALAVTTFISVKSRRKSHPETTSAPSVWNAPFHHVESDWTLESAMFGAEGHQPHNVTPRVQKYIDAGQTAIASNFNNFMDHDPAPYVNKFLTVTMSQTKGESKHVFLPSHKFPAPTPTQRDDELKDISSARYWLIRNAYQALPWQQEFALKIVLDREIITIKALIDNLESKGFTDPKMMIVRDLLGAAVLLDRTPGNLDTVMQSHATETWIKSPEVTKVVRQILKERPLC